MKQLSTAAQFHDGNAGFVLPLPTKLERLVTSPRNRLAVDIHDMAADCSLRTGQLALEMGRTELAREIFTSVVTMQQDESSYYLLQANTWLIDLVRGMDVSLKTP